MRSIELRESKEMPGICFSYQDMDIYIESDENKITRVAFVDKKMKDQSSNMVLDKAKNQILEYLSGKRKYFDVEHSTEPVNTFKGKVYKIVSDIQYGSVMTYKQIAHAIGDANKARAVGWALNKNRTLLFIPCHRVVKTSGETGGFAYGAALKKRLLELEAKNT